MFYTDQLQRPDTCDSVRDLVACLYQTINSEQYYNTKQRLLLAQKEQLRLQLEPLEKVRYNVLSVCNLIHTYCSLLLYLEFRNP